ncbi:hypothetical protein F985_02103 [Acinetobacter seifertii]|uniref:Uncharacterized protein n=1 Tax=Acinetobacter seifertii TaxID=1530123 RepID=N8QXN4_9GAMM|nr:hypothetical protein F985_02103 [Acinetobacter seifertii]
MYIRLTFNVSGDFLDAIQALKIYLVIRFILLLMKNTPIIFSLTLTKIFLMNIMMKNMSLYFMSSFLKILKIL